jgi:hypothetical protein
MANFVPTAGRWRGMDRGTDYQQTPFHSLTFPAPLGRRSVKARPRSGTMHRFIAIFTDHSVNPSWSPLLSSPEKSRRIFRPALVCRCLRQRRR